MGSSEAGQKAEAYSPHTTILEGPRARRPMAGSRHNQTYNPSMYKVCSWTHATNAGHRHEYMGIGRCSQTHGYVRPPEAHIYTNAHTQTHKCTHACPDNTHTSMDKHTCRRRRVCRDSGTRLLRALSTPTSTERTQSHTGLFTYMGTLRPSSGDSVHSQLLPPWTQEQPHKACRAGAWSPLCGEEPRA